MDLVKVEEIVGGLDHPEGVAYGRDGNLYATGELGQVYRISLAEKTSVQIGSSGGFGLGLALDADNNAYVCDLGAPGVVKVTPSGETSLYSQGTADEPLNVPNYPVFDAKGNLYVSHSGGWGEKNGRIYLIRPGGKAEVWLHGASDFTNGMALSPDGRYLYVVESALPGISRVLIKKDSTAGDVELVVMMPDTVPDGLAFDEKGDLYISCYVPDRIYRFTTDGKLEILFDDPIRRTLNAPTNLAFAGPKLDRLAIASLCGWSLAWVDVGVKGYPVHYPKL